MSIGLSIAPVLISGALGLAPHKTAFLLHPCLSLSFFLCYLNYGFFPNTVTGTVRTKLNCKDCEGQECVMFCLLKCPQYLAQDLHIVGI